MDYFLKTAWPIVTLHLLYSFICSVRYTFTDCQFYSLIQMFMKVVTIIKCSVVELFKKNSKGVDSCWVNCGLGTRNKLPCADRQILDYISIQFDKVSNKLGRLWKQSIWQS